MKQNRYKKEFDALLCDRYLTGYAENDPQYKNLLNYIEKILTVTSTVTETLSSLKVYLGEYNILTQKMYLDSLTLYYKKRHKRYPTITELYLMINQELE